MEKVAIVTGAGSGIGAATAKLLAKQNMAVAVLDLNEQSAMQIAEQIEWEGGRAFALRCDVGKKEDVEQAISITEKNWDTPLVLINNAGVGGPFHRVDQVSDDEWDWIINTNLKSVFLFTRNLLPKMKEAGFGRIVNVASIQGLLGSAHSSTYVASKHGMIGYTKTIAAEWGRYGITCNAICPGYVNSQLGIRPEDISDYYQRVMDKSPVQRVADPIEVASLIAHLVGEFGGYINGASYTIDGGISAHVGITSNLTE
ncbi:SDR family NAD(P)-dependent oxidoreductase [Ammoniphilus sp. CFH 90114]|uniref:SDR family NAD(P)-dependent oxidoreductase n=1 Tax=Ammoniphilus sp. CFH 90114 TaxID=2493665 RepID=UPI00100F594B|nr:SDR family oxidoreductase [Ammoniphilus sp. CFH 90114]RXT04550.1 SDR family oxidoreductase [Ammoniphilus sp. CFH 90114]